MAQITIDNICQAAERIEVHRTQALTNTFLSSLASQDDFPIELFFKCELFQKTGCKYIIIF
jgi:threonine dehydratase/serine racemase